MAQITIKKISKVNRNIKTLDSPNLVFSCEWGADLVSNNMPYMTSIIYTDDSWVSNYYESFYWSKNGGTFTVKYGSDQSMCQYWVGKDCYMYLTWDNGNQDNYDTIYDPVPAYYTQVITIDPGTSIYFTIGPDYAGGQGAHNSFPVTGTIEIYEGTVDV